MLKGNFVIANAAIWSRDSREQISLHSAEKASTWHANGTPYLEQISVIQTTLSCSLKLVRVLFGLQSTHAVNEYRHAELKARLATISSD